MAGSYVDQLLSPASLRATGLLVSEGGESGGEPTGVEGAAQLDRPILVEVMEQPRINARPIMNRHSAPLGAIVFNRSIIWAPIASESSFAVVSSRRLGRG